MERHIVDVHVGHRLRLRRIMLGMSQEVLAKATGVTFQQIQKYEKGRNKIAASRLFEFSRILTIPTSYFFEEMDEKISVPENVISNEDNELASKETSLLIKAYSTIEDIVIRKQIQALVAVLGTPENRV